jgi:hypothetical protein
VTTPESSPEPQIDDIEIARYALRTFTVGANSDELSSVAMSGSYWRNGTCEAECLAGGDRQRPMHPAPHEGCTCGIYGTLSLDSLTRQFTYQSTHLVTVIAAEGKTIIGDKGLRTAAARVVAYWSPDKKIRKICKKQLGDAKKFDNLYDMLAAYDVPREAPTGTGGNAVPKPKIRVPITLEQVKSQSVTLTIHNVLPGLYTELELRDGTRCPIQPLNLNGFGAIQVTLDWTPD